MAQFAGKVIAVTGAGSGMGLEVAKVLAERGASVSLADINGDAVADAAQGLGSAQKHISTVLDVRDSKAVNEWIERTLSEFGRLDGAVNMAGIIRPATPTTSLTDEDWELTMAVNATGVMACIRAEINAMQDGGSIVSAASVFGQIGAPGNLAYCASKAAVIAMTRTAAKENGHLRINCVSPGSVNTPLSRGEDPDHVKKGLQVTAQKRRAEPIEIARVIAFLLSDESSNMTGAVVNSDGGWFC